MLNDVSIQTAYEAVMAFHKTPVIKKSFVYDAINYALAEEIKAQRNSPSFTNSAMDGIGIKHSSNKTFKIKTTIFAGDKIENIDLKEDECVKIMTGAQVPTPIDTVVPIEKCKIKDDIVTIPNVKKGANVRLKGEEYSINTPLLHKGEELTSNTAALLFAQGIVNVKVYAKPKIAILSSGNELKEPWDQANHNEVYNVNSHAIKLLLKEYGFESDIIGILPDNAQETQNQIKTLKESYDVIITSGGISFGEADFIFNAFKQNGLKEYFHGITLKPGRPTMIGEMQTTLVCAMPGNPLSAFLNVFFFVIPILRKLSGLKTFHHPIIYAHNIKDFKTNPKKEHFALGEYKNGKWEVYNEYKYGSFMLSALSKANSIAVIEKGKESVSKGEIIKILPFRNFFDKKNFVF